jgi:hypothetical protein
VHESLDACEAEGRSPERRRHRRPQRPTSDDAKEGKPPDRKAADVAEERSHGGVGAWLEWIVVGDRGRALPGDIPDLAHMTVTIP